MAKRFYAVQHGDNYDSDWGSTIKREALKLAKQAHLDYPGEEIRISICRENDDTCESEIIVYEGKE